MSAIKLIFFLRNEDHLTCLLHAFSAITFAKLN